MRILVEFSPFASLSVYFQRNTIYLLNTVICNLLNSFIIMLSFEFYLIFKYYIQCLYNINILAILRSTFFVVDEWGVTPPQPSSLQSFLNSLPEVPEWTLYVVSGVCFLILLTLIVILLCHCCRASHSPHPSPSQPSSKHSNHTRSGSNSDRRLLPCCEQADCERERLQAGGLLNSTQQTTNYANFSECVSHHIAHILCFCEVS